MKPKKFLSISVADYLEAYFTKETKIQRKQVHPVVEDDLENPRSLRFSFTKYLTFVVQTNPSFYQKKNHN